MSMPRRFDSLMRTLLALVACLPMFATRAAPPTLPAEEYAVYSALLAHGLDPASKAIVIAAHTTGDPAGILPAGMATEARAGELGLPLELLRDWGLMNQQRYPLETHFTLNVPPVLLDDARHAALFAGDEPDAGWERFNAAYPGSAGIVRLSRAGFDQARQRAVVYLEFQCGTECGSGRLVELARGEGARWGVISGELIWIAAPRENSRP